MEIPDQANQSKPGHSSCCGVCMLCVAQFFEQNNSFVEQELVKQQCKLQIKNQQEAKKIPDPIFSVTLDEGEVVRNIIRSYTEKNVGQVV